MEGLTVHMVNSIAQVAQLLKQGIANRITSATTMNAHSSRSHAIFTVYLQVLTPVYTGYIYKMLEMFH